MEFYEILCSRIFRKSVGEIQVWLTYDKNNGYFTWRPISYMIISGWIVILRNTSDKICGENQNKHILCSVKYCWTSCLLWDNVEQYVKARQHTDDDIIRRMRVTCWITKATDTHSEYVIRIAFPRKQWLQELASVLRYPYIASCIRNYYKNASITVIIL